MCKMGCGLPVQPGLTRGMKAFDTCCKQCAQGKGGHDANCGGASSSPMRKETLEDPQKWLKQLLSSPAMLEKHLITAGALCLFDLGLRSWPATPSRSVPTIFGRRSSALAAPFADVWP